MIIKQWTHTCILILERLREEPLQLCLLGRNYWSKQLEPCHSKVINCKRNANLCVIDLYKQNLCLYLGFFLWNITSRSSVIYLINTKNLLFEQKTYPSTFGCAIHWSFVDNLCTHYILVTIFLYSEQCLV